MEQKITEAILYCELDDELGPNALTWRPSDIEETTRMHISIKAFTVLSGERGLIPNNLVILPFPSLNLKGLVKYLKWNDKDRRGGIAQSAIILVFKEIDDAIFYKYLDYFDPLFNDVGKEFINLELEKEELDIFNDKLSKLQAQVEYLIKDLRIKELSQNQIEAFPEKKLQPTDVDYKFKIVIVGDPGVGKTSLILRFTNNAFRRSYIPTLGVHISDKIFKVDDATIQMVLWDIAGQQKFSMLRQQFYLGTDGIFLIFDLTNAETFENISTWYQDVENQLDDRTLLGYVIGNKKDLINRMTVDSNYAINLATKLQLGYIETSARTGENVDEAFYEIAKMLYDSLKDEK
ncbi:MAG: GTP-binding protein [Promethearchaeota archaeon]|nr:MAG: GTP-binding protein [Candidatus Lokiarchaeota archaeon]